MSVRLTVDGNTVIEVTMDEPKRDLKDLLLHGSGNAVAEPEPLKFDATDFAAFTDWDAKLAARVAQRANEVLNAWLENAPDVYAWLAESFEQNGRFWKAIEIEPANNEYTHRARLVAIRREEKT